MVDFNSRGSYISDTAKRNSKWFTIKRFLGDNFCELWRYYFPYSYGKSHSMLLAIFTMGIFNERH